VVALGAQTPDHDVGRCALDEAVDSEREDRDATCKERRRYGDDSLEDVPPDR
jgi:hypothetical protein